MRRISVGLVSLLLAGAAAAQTVPLPPASPPVLREPSPEARTATRTEMQELIEAARATATATREGVDYNRVVPDILTQILAKLDKIEDKLDKLDTGRTPRKTR